MNQVIKRGNEISLRALGRTTTNPNVGAVVFDTASKIILGEGYHKKYGQSHAEVNAIDSTPPESINEYSCIAVSLEPCNHFGKTPPCTQKILDAKIQSVYIDQLDPNVNMQGKSLGLLRSRNISVQGPINSQLGQEVLRPFCVQQKHKRPYIIIKMALSQNGCVSHVHQKTKISNKLSDRWVHRWRSEVDAILVGGNTLKIDNPELNSRYNNIYNPIRVCIDYKNDLNPSLKIFNNSGRNLIFSNLKRSNSLNTTYIYAENLSIPNIMNMLYAENVGSILIEGGPTTVSKYLELGLWDEIRIIQNNELWIKNGTKAPNLFEMGNISYRKNLGNDTVYVIKR